jgi:hypothetical protein
VAELDLDRVGAASLALRAAYEAYKACGRQDAGPLVKAVDRLLSEPTHPMLLDDIKLLAHLALAIDNGVPMDSSDAVWSSSSRLQNLRFRTDLPDEAQAQVCSNLSVNLWQLDRRVEALDAALEATETYRRLAALQPDRFTGDLARSLFNLAIYFTELSRRAEALEAALEANESYRRLAAVGPDAFSGDLASSLSNLGNCYGALNRRAEALEAALEATELRRRLADARPDAFSGDLAASLSNLSLRYRALNRRADALKVAQEAYEMYRRLAATVPDAFNSDLAASLSNLGKCYGALNRRADAVKAAQGATEMYRRLAAVEPVAFSGDLASSLSNLGIRLSELNRRVEALEAALEATELRRGLAAAQPDVFTGELASSLSNLSVYFGELNRRAEALEAALEATELRRGLAAAEPDAFTGDLASSLLNLSTCLSELNRRVEALDAAQEATALYRGLAALQPDAFTGDLASSLSNLSVYFGELNRRAEALEAALEATELRRGLTGAQPDVFTGDLASSLSNLSTCLGELNRRAEALEAALEATELRRGLAAVQPEAFSADLARSLSNLSACHGELNQRVEALEAALEATELRRGLAGAQPDAFSGDLARSLSVVGNCYGELNRRAEALDATLEATELYRGLAVGQPDAFTGDLAGSLSNLSNRYGELNRRAQALETGLEATELYRVLAGVQPDAFSGDLARSLTNLGGCYRDLNRRANALEAWRNALGISAGSLETRSGALSGVLRAGPHLRDDDLGLWLSNFRAQAILKAQGLSSSADRRAVLKALGGVGSLGFVYLGGRLERLGEALEWADATVAVESRLTSSLRDATLERLAIEHPWLTDRLLSALRPASADGIPVEARREDPLTVLNEIRRLPGFSRFLNDRTAPEILGALSGVPLALVAAGAGHGVVLTVDRFGQMKVTEVALSLDDLIDHLIRTITDGGDRGVAARLGLRTIVSETIARPIAAFALDNPDVVVVPLGLVGWLPIQSTLAVSHGLSVSVRPTIVPVLASTADGPPLVVHSDGTDDKPNLPGARSEASHIAAMLGVESLTDGAMTALMVNDRFAGSRFVHFSCHGWADLSDPERSGLLIGSTMLTVSLLNEEMIRRGAPRFVGLSACQSARTEAVSPEQASSLANVFLAHGTRAVLATHWNVNDELSRAIATGFCDRWAAGMTAGEAFEATLRQVRGGWRTRAIDTVFAFCLLGDRDLMWPGESVRNDRDQRAASIEGLVVRYEQHGRAGGQVPLTNEEFAQFVLQVLHAAPPEARVEVGPLIAAWLDAPEGTRFQHRHALAREVGAADTTDRSDGKVTTPERATDGRSEQHRSESIQPATLAKLETMAKRS